jgi:hypothetical protein
VPADLPNLRDVGGLTTHEGRPIRSGVLLRSALPAPDDLVPDGLHWPPAVVIDLRSEIEHGDGHPLQDLCPRVINLPLLSALAPGRQDIDTLQTLYQLVVEDAAEMLVDLVHEVADADGPALVHCAAGKDRTGVGVALVLRLVGVTREEVLSDYVLTDHAREAIDVRLRRDDIHPSYPVSFYLVAPEAIEGVLDHWDAHPGGTYGWFIDAGGDPARVERLRDRLLG